MEDVIEKQIEQDVSGLVKKSVKFEMIAVSKDTHVLLKELKKQLKVRSINAVIEKLLEVKGLE